MICLEPLLMDPCFMPAFRPIAAAIDWICIICNVDVTVFDRMNLFSVHDKAISSIAIRKHSFEEMQQPAMNQMKGNNKFNVYNLNNTYNTYNMHNTFNVHNMK